ncbi:MAG: DNA polymerase III subunit gamma/tau [candidate division KSB1 bacterium]|nr:DNA polymerase III subunit gamma/tau [candidate division KSB1 bacterium]
MAYQVLARKYRPMLFEDVIGQQHVTLTLQNAIKQNRLAGAYLFSGPRGVGKTTVARILSKAINCDNGLTDTPCNTCSSCVEINESRSLDVLEIDGASNRGIDEVRNLRESLRYSPNPNKYRIHIIDEVHMLTNEAFNALLKTLEEPPERVLFIFATTEPHKVPATILSRCQRFDFKRISNQQLVEQLKQLCKKEELEAEDEALRLIAVKGDGSMRDSESILDQVIAYAGTRITAEDTSQLLGLIGQSLFFRVTDHIHNNEVDAGIELVEHIFSEGYDFNEFILGLAEHFRNFMVARATNSAAELDVSEEFAARYLQEAERFEIEDLLRMIKITADAENALRRSSNARLHLEVTLIKLIKMNSSVQLSDLLSEFEQIKKKTDLIPKKKASDPPGTPVTQKPPEPDPQPQRSPLPSTKHVSSKETPPITLDDIEKKWTALLEQVKHHKIGLGTILSDAWPMRVTENNLILAFGKRNGFQMNTAKRESRFLESLIKEFYGHPLRLMFTLIEPEKIESIRKIPSQVDKEKVFQELRDKNPMLKRLSDTFDVEFIK